MLSVLKQACSILSFNLFLSDSFVISQKYFHCKIIPCDRLAQSAQNFWLGILNWPNVHRLPFVKNLFVVIYYVYIYVSNKNLFIVHRKFGVYLCKKKKYSWTVVVYNLSDVFKSSLV